MKQLRAKETVLMLVCCLLLTACVSLKSLGPDNLITPLPKLTLAIQALVRWPPDGVAMTDEKMLATVYEKKPELREAFSCYTVKIWHNTRDVVVLVCSPDGQRGIMEDASATPGVDRVWYQTDPMHPAQFSLIPEMGSKK